jgi:hypothetical protein
MAIKILLILLLINIDVFAETEREEEKRFSDFLISEMEEKCKFLEKERSAKKHKKDVVPDSNSAIAIALDAAYSIYNVVPKVNSGGWVSLIGEHKEYWYVALYRLRQDFRGVYREVGLKTLISRNNGTLLCSGLTNTDTKWEFK